jgi:hypothetical protein
MSLWEEPREQILDLERDYNYNIQSSNQDKLPFLTKVILTGIYALLNIKICCSEVP